MENSRQLLADNIEYFLKVRGMRQSDLANRVGVSRSAVSEWKTANKKADFSNIDRMAEAFGVSVYELFLDHSNSSYSAREEHAISVLLENNAEARTILSYMKMMPKKKLKAMRIIIEEIFALELDDSIR